MKKSILALIGLTIMLVVSSCCEKEKVAPEVQQYYKDSLAVLMERCEKVLDAAYMAENHIGERRDIPNWEGFPVQEYEYFTGTDVKIKQPKRGRVYLLNPDAEKLAKWIVNAVYDATGEIEYEDVERIRKYIMWQSGAQFPVSGVVYEAMYEPGFYEPYVFKDGVTVYIADQNMWPADKHCTDEQLEFYLHITNDDLKAHTGRYARICSTTREMYYNAGGTEEVGKSDSQETRIHAWLDVVRKHYQEAWDSDKNFLITAWAKANLVEQEDTQE